MTDHAALLGALRKAAGAERVRTDDAARRLWAACAPPISMPPAALVRQVKAMLDPQDLANPRVPGLR